MSQQPAGKRAGRVFLFLFWAALLFLASRYFAHLQQSRENPNPVVASEHGQGFVEVRLASNGQGHFVASGMINGKPVQFMLDTGATDVAVSRSLAEKLKLPYGYPITVSTANGNAQGYRTRLDSLQLGDIVLKDVRAVAIPDMDGDQVLLGMSALKQLEFSQRGGTMLLRQTTQ
ncbi:hypothetical protein PMM47T1_09961 [Pseudomonas sp. M47T1]|uniref:retropepsin-like aspartic protease family protein n=1 Tax=unclassified Pseudomonas TaxID=196821 RepID=UPI0002606F07|nr:TIGR02281 family clan AA aspartic protease [Pseudomonas sp. M47T1]EIK96976.1 hypothetical protein PMM47T1_09961 [Pseudomonas sp. M47T1]